MSRLKRHTAKPIKREFVNEDGERDVYTFKPLSLKMLPEFMKLTGIIEKTGLMSKKFEELDEEKQTSKILEMLNKENTELIISLLKDMMKQSFPDEKEENINSFIKHHFTNLIGILFEVNTYESKTKNRKIKK